MKHFTKPIPPEHFDRAWCAGTQAALNVMAAGGTASAAAQACIVAAYAASNRINQQMMEH